MWTYMNYLNILKSKEGIWCWDDAPDEILENIIILHLIHIVDTLVQQNSLDSGITYMLNYILI